LIDGGLTEIILPETRTVCPTNFSLKAELMRAVGFSIFLFLFLYVVFERKRRRELELARDANPTSRPDNANQSPGRDQNENGREKYFSTIPIRL